MDNYRMGKESYEEEDEIDLMILFSDFWKGLKKYWWLCVCLAALCSLGIYLWTVMTYVPMYRSESMFTITINQSSNIYDEASNNYEFSYTRSGSSQLAKTFPYILESDVLLDIVREDLGVDEINGTISVSSVESSNLFTLIVTSSSPQDAKLILDSVIDNYPDVSKYVIGNTKFNIIEPSFLATEPCNTPNYRKLVAIGALAGILLGLAAIVIYAMTRKTVRKPEDLKEKLNITSLGEVPLVQFKQRKQKKDTAISVYNEKVGYGFNEAMRALTVRVEKDMDEHQEKILMITSTLPGEGKSVLALNLAYCLARKGKKVALIDANLLKPDIRNLAGINAADGEFADFLRGKEPVKLFVSKISERRLVVAGSTMPAKNSTKMLGSNRMKRMLKKLTETFDYILIDTPPMAVSADAAVLAEMADAVLYVVRQDDAKIWDVMDNISMLSTNAARIMGCVFNQMKAGLDGYGYGYGSGKYGYGKYGYGRYGYGYGYGEGRERTEREGKAKTTNKSDAVPKSGIAEKHLKANTKAEYDDSQKKEE